MKLMKPILHSILVHALVSASALADTALIDFGRNGNLGIPDLRTTGSSPTYNNLALGNNNNTNTALQFTSTTLTTVPIAIDGGFATATSAALVDTAGASSGITISFQGARQNSTFATNGSVGTSGADYTGTLPPDVSSLASNATTDSVYVGGSAILKVTLSGLDNSKTYDLTALSGRPTAKPNDGGIWALVTGSATTSRFQDSAGTYTANTGQLVNASGANAAIAAEWLGVTPVGGEIVFDLTSKVSSGGFVNFNTLSITTTGAATYAAWQTANSTSQTIDQDHDLDGVSNGVEFFLGGTTDTTGFTPVPSVVNTAGTLSATWVKAASYSGAYNTDFVVETSETLTGAWTVETPGTDLVITGNDVKYTFPSPLGAKKFARLRVTGP